MSTAAVELPYAPRTRGPAEVLLLRFLAAAAFLAVPTAMTILSTTARTHDLIRALSRYTPERLVHGAVWTLPLSAFLLPHLAMIGPTTIFTVAIFVPYALLRGMREALIVFLVGHVAVTVAAAAYIVPAHMLGAHAGVLYDKTDVGASAGLAAVVGAAAAVLTLRHRILGIALGVAAVAFYLQSLWLHPRLGSRLADSEHLMAIAVGAVVVLVLERRRNRAPSS